MDKKIYVKTPHVIPSPYEIKRYLEDTGWVPQPDQNNYQVYKKTIDGDDIELFACTKDRFADYPLRAADLLRNLEIIEKRSEALILNEMKSVRTPYIGITDFISKEQILETAELLKGTDRKIQAGIMLSYKTLNNLPTKWEGVWPNKSTIKDIFVRNYYVLNCLHYADYEGVDVLRSLIEATAYGGPNMDALQLDMIWPDPRDIQAYRSAFPSIKLILQVGSAAFEQVNNDEDELIKKLQQYPIDYVLLDKSGGRGIEMSIDGLLPFVRRITTDLPISIAIAGGLGPHNVSMLAGLLEEFPDISLDAQSKLRPSGNSMDALDMEMAKKYVIQAKNMLRKD